MKPNGYREQEFERSCADCRHAGWLVNLDDHFLCFHGDSADMVNDARLLDGDELSQFWCERCIYPEGVCPEFQAGEPQDVTWANDFQVPSDRGPSDRPALKWHEATETPTQKGWYECLAVDDRWNGEMQYRAWGNGFWWTPLPDGWLSSRNGIYRWRGPVADVNGPAPDGTDPKPQQVPGE